MTSGQFPAQLDGELRPVTKVAEKVLGRPITPNTVRRWALVGRAGVPLPTVRGPQRQHHTTEPAFRQWLAATSEGSAPAAAHPSGPDRAADAVLAGFGLGRKGA